MRGLRNWSLSSMERLLEYIQNHPLLVGLALVMAVAVLAYELRTRGQEATSVQPQEAIRLMNQGAQVLDVRDAAAFATGHVTGARLVSSDQKTNAAEALKKYKDKALVLCCESGQQSAGLARTLQSAGFAKVFNLRGGLAAWRAESLPLQRG
jgi:rhodanese-related sulfurtransferase